MKKETSKPAVVDIAYKDEWIDNSLYSLFMQQPVLPETKITMLFFVCLENNCV